MEPLRGGPGALGHSAQLSPSVLPGALLSSPRTDLGSRGRGSSRQLPSCMSHGKYVS